MVRVLCCGGRHFTDEEKIKDALADLIVKRGPITHLIHGDAFGADRLSGKIASGMTGVTVMPFPANWDKYGKRAGPMRNQQMIDEGKPNVVLAFEGGIGTADMCRKASKAGIEVIHVE